MKRNKYLLHAFMDYDSKSLYLIDIFVAVYNLSIE